LSFTTAIGQKPSNSSFIPAPSSSYEHPAKRPANALATQKKLDHATYGRKYLI
jgi:hypothetical protein